MCVLLRNGVLWVKRRAEIVVLAEICAFLCEFGGDYGGFWICRVAERCLFGSRKQDAHTRHLAWELSIHVSDFSGCCCDKIAEKDSFF